MPPCEDRLPLPATHIMFREDDCKWSEDGALSCWAHILSGETRSKRKLITHGSMLYRSPLAPVTLSCVILLLRHASCLNGQSLQAEAPTSSSLSVLGR